MIDIEPLLVAYVDGELDAASVAEVERILAENPEARRSVDIYRETATLLRAACAESNYATGPAVLPLVRPRRIARWRLPAAVAAAVLLLAAGYAAGWLTAPPPPGDGFIDDVAEYHEVYSRETTHLAELPADQADEIGRWLGGRLQRPLTAPDLRPEGLHFAGARLWVSEGKPVADLLYTRMGGLPVALCIVHAPEGKDAAGSGITVTAREDLRVAFWQDQGYTFAIVGDLTAAQVLAIAKRARMLSES